MVLLSFPPLWGGRGRQSANPEGGMEGTKKKEKNVGFTCNLLCVAHSINVFQMHKCEEKISGKGRTLILSKNRQTELHVDSGFSSHSRTNQG